MPSVRTMWQPTPREGLRWAISTASLKAAPEAMRVAEVRTPARCRLSTVLLTPGVRPKSSALMMSRAGMSGGEGEARASEVVGSEGLEPPTSCL